MEKITKKQAPKGCLRFNPQIQVTEDTFLLDTEISSRLYNFFTGFHPNPKSKFKEQLRIGHVMEMSLGAILSSKFFDHYMKKDFEWFCEEYNIELND